MLQKGKIKMSIHSNRTLVLILVAVLLGAILFLQKKNITMITVMEKITNDDSSTMDIFANVLRQSDEQRLIDKRVIMKTAQFMIEERDENDPELIEFVRSLIVMPDRSKKLNLNNKNRNDFSQMGQSAFIDDMLGHKRDGFFLEAGGLDGESHSNTVFFELERGWTGLLIEPIPHNYQKILTKNRNIYVLNACIANKRPLLSKFRVQDSDGALSGRLSEMSDAHLNRIDGYNSTKVYVTVPCFSLNTIMMALDVYKIDYFSLDVEGGEWSILQAIDFSNLNIKSFSIEHNGNEDKKKSMIDHLAANNYNLTKTDSLDIYFIKP